MFQAKVMFDPCLEIVISLSFAVYLQKHYILKEYLLDNTWLCHLEKLGSLGISNKCLDAKNASLRLLIYNILAQEMT